jgi:hypothetical protein
MHAERGDDHARGRASRIRREREFAAFDEGQTVGGTKVARSVRARLSRPPCDPRQNPCESAFLFFISVGSVSNSNKALRAANSRQHSVAITIFPPYGPTETLKGLGRTPAVAHAWTRFGVFRQ